LELAECSVVSFTDFAVVDLKSTEELGRIFSQHSTLVELFDLHIKPLTTR